MSLPPEVDPSGFMERAPALASLLPDEALDKALATGDASVLYRVLLGRLAVEPAGPARDTLAGLVADRSLFAVAEAPPTVRSVLGTGTALPGAPHGSRRRPTSPPASSASSVCRCGPWASTSCGARGRVRREVLGACPAPRASTLLRWGAVVAFVPCGSACRRCSASTVPTAR